MKPLVLDTVGSMKLVTQEVEQKKAAPKETMQDDTASVGLPGDGTEPAADGRTTRWANHREQRRTDLLNVARKLIHAEGPGITMERLALASGTSKSIIYRYFLDKSELQRALGLHLFNAMHRELAASASAAERSTHTPAEGIRAMVFAFVTAAHRSRNLFDFVTQPTEGLGNFLDSVNRLVASILPATMSAAERELFAAGAVSLVHDVTRQWLHSPPAHPIHSLSAPEVTDMIVRWLTDSPLSTHQGKDALS